tara:strand:+ start:786 stop:1376 length:591 start_codon:yes stop_codon:yes gene_type:complete
MNELRKESIKSIQKNSEAELIIITKDNLYEHLSEPLHESFQFLSYHHKSDYLRCYFMNFYGGGYSDVKPCVGSWSESFNLLKQNHDKWICGFQEYFLHSLFHGRTDIIEKHYPQQAHQMGTQAMICRPQTDFTKEWYKLMLCKLDSKKEQFKNSTYPIKWNEILLDIFEPLCKKYYDKIIKSLPAPDCSFQTLLNS